MYVNLICSYQQWLQLLRKHNSKAKDFEHFWLKCYTWFLVVSVLFSGGTMVKNLPANAGDAGSAPRSGRSPGIGNGNPLQSSSMENSIDSGAWWAIVHGIVKSQTQLSIHTHPFLWSIIVHKWQANIHKYLERCHWCRRHFLIVHSGDSLSSHDQLQWILTHSYSPMSIMQLTLNISVGVAYCQLLLKRSS